MGCGHAWGAHRSPGTRFHRNRSWLFHSDITATLLSPLLVTINTITSHALPVISPLFSWCFSLYFIDIFSKPQFPCLPSMSHLFCWCLFCLLVYCKYGYNVGNSIRYSLYINLLLVTCIYSDWLVLLSIISHDFSCLYQHIHVSGWLVGLCILIRSCLLLFLFAWLACNILFSFNSIAAVFSVLCVVMEIFA